MSTTIRYFPLLAMLLLGACVSMPSGPSMMVLPGTGKSFEQFRADDAACRQYAHYQMSGMTADQAAIDSGVRSAALGTLLGAAAGAAIDGHSGASTGAGAGLLFGGMAGAGAATSSGYELQQRYDFAYLQCMYAKGHRVPVAGRLSGGGMQREVQPPARGYAVPPPNTLPPRY